MQIGLLSFTFNNNSEQAKLEVHTTETRNVHLGFTVRENGGYTGLSNTIDQFLQSGRLANQLNSSKS